MFPQRLKEARKNNNITQEALAEKIGVKRAVISKYESGTVSPSVETMQKIADALSVPLSELLVDKQKFSILEALGLREKMVQVPPVSQEYQENIKHLAQIGASMPSDVLQAFVNMLDGASDDEIDQIISFGRVYRSVSDKKPTGFNIVFADEKPGNIK